MYTVLWQPVRHLQPFDRKPKLFLSAAEWPTGHGMIPAVVVVVGAVVGVVVVVGFVGKKRLCVVTEISRRKIL